MKTTKMDWGMWVAAVLRQLHRGDIEGAANTLSCCLPELGENPSEVDQWGQNLMFTQPALKDRHQQLWDAMKPSLVPEYVGSVAEWLRRGFGWRIA